MKKTRIFALLLALVLTFSLLCTVASAASTTYVDGAGTVTVTTVKRPWYALFSSPKVTVKNIGNSSATVYLYNSNGQKKDAITTLKRGKSTTFSMKWNSTYTIAYSGHYTVGPYSDLKLTPNKYVREMWG